MVKMDSGSHDILKRWKKKLRDQGIRVPLGGTIREMEKLIKDQDNLGFSKTDIRETMKEKKVNLRKITKEDVEAALGAVYYFVMNLDNIDRKKSIEFGAEMMLAELLNNDNEHKKIIESVNKEKKNVEKYTLNLKQYFIDTPTDDQIEQIKALLDNNRI